MIEPFAEWILASARLITCSVVAPMFAHRALPMWARLALAAALSLALLAQEPTRTWATTAETSSSSWLLALGSEAMLGLVMGLALSLIVIAAKMVGQLLSQMAGFAWDGGEGSTELNPPGSRLMGWMALLMYIAVGGPELLVGAVLDSYRAIPVGGELQDIGGRRGLAVVLQYAFWLALCGVGPAAACWLVVQAAFGLIQRLAPQLGFFQFGFQANLAVFWLSLLLTAVGSAWLFEREIANVIEQIAAAG
ncbi:MAG TPA: flagellar biosynthetic protein FliR [Pirellulaceae bacterium]|nr:flagellar biosynthetic protein FliR [Pirellulaceae bacterium]